MSWINDLKECFARTEAEKKMHEAQLRIEVGNKIAEKSEEFRKNYEKVCQHDATKVICDKLLRQIELID